MKNIILLLATMFACMAVSQEVTLKFTCQADNGTYHPFDRVQVANLTRGWNHTLTYPDTTLTITLGDNEESIVTAKTDKIQLFHTYPNPFKGRCSSMLCLAKSEKVTVEVISLTGVPISSYSGHLPAGQHLINISLSEPQIAILRVSISDGIATTKIHNISRSQSNSLTINTFSLQVPKENCTETFAANDEMYYQAYRYADDETWYSYPISETLGDGGEKILIFSSTQPSSNIFDENGAHFKTFSVSDTSSVRFSRGNLQYTTVGSHTVADGNAANGTWRFANKQYLFVGTENTNIADDYEGWIDMFGWGTSGWQGGITAYQPYSTSGNTGHYCISGNASTSMTGNYNYADWGVYNAISNGGNRPEMWRTLTKDEWVYLLRTRRCSTVGNTTNARYAKATVCDVAGLMLFPDTYVHPSGVAIPTGINVTPTTSGLQAFFADNIYNEKDWELLEQAGVIFLPAAGRRVGINAVSAGSGGFYWSATAGGGMPYDISYTDSYLYIFGNGDRSQGRTVRLVRDE